jgi:phytoene dehydrogenase-like protein
MGGAMENRYDVVIIGSGLGGLTAAALLARAGRKTLLIERNHGVGGAASTYKAGDLVVEASLHETSDPRDPIDPKHHILARIGVLDELEWVPTGSLYEVRGGPVGTPFSLPEGFGAAERALCERFPSARGGVKSILCDMERLSSGLGTLSKGREAFRNPRDGFKAVAKLGPLPGGWRLSLGDRLRRAFGDNEAVKCALAANLAYWHDDPETLWWILFAVAQGGYLGSGSRYIRGGSQRLSNALARSITAAGGEILRGRSAVEITIDKDGRTAGLVHESRKGGDRAEVRAPIIVSNAAPAVIAAILPETARGVFWAPYCGRQLSISLFSATFGLSVRPAEVGLRSYSTFLLPAWMKSLGDYRRSVELLAALPSTTGQDRPILTVVNYSAIESGLGGPPFPVSVVGIDRVENWAALSAPAFEEKRNRWREAIIETIDHEFPGFASKIVTGVFNTACSMRDYLNAPDGAIYGFAPLPPSGPIWRGQANAPKTPIPGLYLASAYAGTGGFTGAILAGAMAADCILAGK